MSNTSRPGGSDPEPFRATITPYHMPLNTVVCRVGRREVSGQQFQPESCTSNKIHTFRIPTHKVGIPVRCTPMTCPTDGFNFVCSAYCLRILLTQLLHHPVTILPLPTLSTELQIEDVSSAPDY